MNLYRSARAVAGARGDAPIDWTAATEAAKAAVDPGDLTLDAEERAGYARDVREARERVQEVSGLAFDLPETIQVQHRHHWIDANVDTFARVLAPVAEETTAVPGAARAINTGSMAVTLSFLANNVLGQYDPLLLADGDEHALYFVRPNILRVSETLSVDRDRFRRWIALHEVAHAAEFGAAPWLSAHLEERVERGLAELARSRLPREALRELDTAMTAVEGYAELVMDRAFEGEFADLRRKLDERRRGRGPVTRLFRRLLGLGLKRRQYERGKAFFETVAEARGVRGASRVWDGPSSLPTDAELDDPAKWLARVR